MAGSPYSYGYGDPGSPYPYDYRDPGPYFHRNMGTGVPKVGGPHFHMTTGLLCLDGSDCACV